MRERGGAVWGCVVRTLAGVGEYGPVCCVHRMAEWAVAGDGGENSQQTEVVCAAGDGDVG